MKMKIRINMTAYRWQALTLVRIDRLSERPELFDINLVGSSIRLLQFKH